MYCKEPIYGPMAADDIVNGVLTAGLRPQIPADTPFVFIKLIESCWQTDPNLRYAIATLSICAVACTQCAFMYSFVSAFAARCCARSHSPTRPAFEKIIRILSQPAEKLFTYAASK